MPADVELFDMLRPNVLEAMTTAQLMAELDRISAMYQRVNEYKSAVVGIAVQREDREHHD